MDDWKRQLRRRKRGEHCLTGPKWRCADGTIKYGGGLCGCGHRTPPSKANRTRIAKRTLARDLSRQLRSPDA